MLGKLIKYEFKATGKIFLLFYAGLLFMSILNMLIMPWGPTGDFNFAMFDSFSGSSLEIVTGIMQSLLFIMYILLAIAVALITYVAVVIRFYKLLGDEGYLMFTLPVKASTHLLSKLIVAVIWFICSTIVITASIFIVIGDVHVFKTIGDWFSDLTAMGMHPWAWIISFIVILILGGAGGFLEFYLAIALGPHITKSRLGGSIIGYIIVYTVVQIISSLSVFALMIPFRGFDGSALYDSTPFPDEMFFFSTFSIYCIALILIIGIPSYIITHHLIKNKLNLG